MTNLLPNLHEAALALRADYKDALDCKATTAIEAHLNRNPRVLVYDNVKDDLLGERFVVVYDRKISIDAMVRYEANRLDIDELAR